MFRSNLELDQNMWDGKGLYHPSGFTSPCLFHFPPLKVFDKFVMNWLDCLPALPVGRCKARLSHVRRVRRVVVPPVFRDLHHAKSVFPARETSSGESVLTVELPGLAMNSTEASGAVFGTGGNPSNADIGPNPGATEQIC